MGGDGAFAGLYLLLHVGSSPPSCWGDHNFHFPEIVIDFHFSQAYGGIEASFDAWTRFKIAGSGFWRFGMTYCDCETYLKKLKFK
jgi:hypothetical protein